MDRLSVVVLLAVNKFVLRLAAAENIMSLAPLIGLKLAKDVLRHVST